MNQNTVDNTNDTGNSNLLSSPTTTSNQDAVNNTTDRINNGDDLELSDPQDFSTERTEAPTELPFVYVLPPLRPNEDVPAVLPELPAYPAEDDWFTDFDSHDFDSHDGTATTSSSSSGLPLEGFAPVAVPLVLGLAILFMVFNCVRWHNRQDGRNKRQRTIPYGHDTTNTTVTAHACAVDTSAPMATAVAIGDGGISSGGGFFGGGFSGGGDCGGGGGDCGGGGGF